jgi:eukaryotic-like serine/threonine-protein kinase
LLLRLGKYLLLERINQGGMAEVHLAKALGYGGTDQIVALKCVRPGVSDDASFLSMFVEEAKLAVQLQHANVARTYELGSEEGWYYIAMEHLAGRDLRAVIDRAKFRAAPLPEPLVLYIVRQMLEGLDYAHRKTDPTGKPLHIVHRDVSPQNVIVGYGGEVKLIDFGIAKAASQAPGLQQQGVLRGKYGYMSPEQVRGMTVDARSDIFAVGVLAYELLTMERLFDGTSDLSILEKVRYGEVYPPALLAPRVSPALEAIVLRALGREPEERYQSASDMNDAVTRLMLEHYGSPSARELGTLMTSLFGDEIRADQRMLDEARRITELPPGTASVTEPHPVLEPFGEEKTEVTIHVPEAPPTEAREVTEPEIRPAGLAAAAAAAPAPAPVSSAATRPTIRFDGATTDQIRMAVPTRILNAYTRPGLRRDLLILTVALILAVALVASTWIATRASQGNQGRLIIQSEPANAMVSIDGAERGPTPYASDGMPPGRHLLTVHRRGFAAESRIVEVLEGRVITLYFTLRPEGPP